MYNPQHPFAQWSLCFYQSQSSIQNVIFHRCEHVLCYLKGFVSKDCALLGYYAAISGNSLQTFRENLSVPSLRFKNPK